MARLISIVAIIGIALAIVVTAEEELYSDKYDDIDVNEILTNDRLREEYYECFIGRAPCTTATMKFYKSTFIYTQRFFVRHILNSFFITKSVSKSGF